MPHICSKSLQPRGRLALGTLTAERSFHKDESSRHHAVRSALDGSFERNIYFKRSNVQAFDLSTPATFRRTPVERLWLAQNLRTCDPGRHGPQEYLTQPAVAASLRYLKEPERSLSQYSLTTVRERPEKGDTSASKSMQALHACPAASPAQCRLSPIEPQYNRCSRRPASCKPCGSGPLQAPCKSRPQSLIQVSQCLYVPHLPSMHMMNIRAYVRFASSNATQHSCMSALHVLHHFHMAEDDCSFSLSCACTKATRVMTLVGCSCMYR